MMRLSSAFLFLVLSAGLKAQEAATPTPVSSDHLYLGIGAGLDHGGFGVRADVPVTNGIALFLGVGYALVGPGWNLGALYRFKTASNVRAYATALYGYNGVIMVQDAEQYNDVYYGFSGGFGLEFRNPRTSNFFRMAVLVPFRSAEFWSDWNDLKDNKGIEVKQGPLPVAFSVGYHFAL
jgi:hypothetical protein